MTATRPLRSVLGASLAVLTLTLAACGGDDDDADTLDTVDTTADVAATAPGSDTTAAGAETTAAGGTDATMGDGAGADASRDDYVEAGLASLGAVVGDAGECVVTSIVDGLGVDNISDTGLSPEEFWSASSPMADSGLTADSPEVSAVADDIADCDGLMRSFAALSGEDVPDEDVECMEDGGASELVGQLLALQMIGADTADLEAEGDALAEDCGIE